MKLVAVSQRVEHLPERGEGRDALDQAMGAFLCAAGVLPVPVPNTLMTEQVDRTLLKPWLLAVKPHAVVLTGGDDLGMDANRDRTEDALLNFARAQKLPVLGICRGMQAMGVWAGTTLRPVDGHVRTRHAISGAIAGTVNSFHAFALEACPKDFEVAARSGDGQIEAIRNRTARWEGWMWHPEREPEFDERDLRTVRALFCEGSR